MLTSSRSLFLPPTAQLSWAYASTPPHVSSSASAPASGLSVLTSLSELAWDWRALRPTRDVLELSAGEGRPLAAPLLYAARRPLPCEEAAPAGTGGCSGSAPAAAGPPALSIGDAWLLEPLELLAVPVYLDPAAVPYAPSISNLNDTSSWSSSPAAGSSLPALCGGAGLRGLLRQVNGEPLDGLLDAELRGGSYLMPVFAPGARTPGPGAPADCSGNLSEFGHLAYWATVTPVDVPLYGLPQGDGDSVPSGAGAAAAGGDVRGGGDALHHAGAPPLTDARILNARRRGLKPLPSPPASAPSGKSSSGRGGVLLGSAAPVGSAPPSLPPSQGKLKCGGTGDPDGMVSCAPPSPPDAPAKTLSSKPLAAASASASASPSCSGAGFGSPDASESPALYSTATASDGREASPTASHTPPQLPVVRSVLASADPWSSVTASGSGSGTPSVTSTCTGIDVFVPGSLSPSRSESPTPLPSIDGLGSSSQSRSSSYTASASRATAVESVSGLPSSGPTWGTVAASVPPVVGFNSETATRTRHPRKDHAGWTAMNTVSPSATRSAAASVSVTGSFTAQPSSQVALTSASMTRVKLQLPFVSATWLAPQATEASASMTRSAGMGDDDGGSPIVPHEPGPPSPAGSPPLVLPTNEPSGGGGRPPEPSSVPLPPGGASPSFIPVPVPVWPLTDAEGCTAAVSNGGRSGGPSDEEGGVTACEAASARAWRRGHVVGARRLLHFGHILTAAPIGGAAAALASAVVDSSWAPGDSSGGNNGGVVLVLEDVTGAAGFELGFAPSLPQLLRLQQQQERNPNASAAAAPVAYPGFGSWGAPASAWTPAWGLSPLRGKGSVVVLSSASLDSRSAAPSSLTAVDDSLSAWRYAGPRGFGSTGARFIAAAGPPWPGSTGGPAAAAAAAAQGCRSVPLTDVARWMPGVTADDGPLTHALRQRIVPLGAVASGSDSAFNASLLSSLRLALCGPGALSPAEAATALATARLTRTYLLPSGGRVYRLTVASAPEALGPYGPTSAPGALALCVAALTVLAAAAAFALWCQSRAAVAEKAAAVESARELILSAAAQRLRGPLHALHEASASLASDLGVIHTVSQSVVSIASTPPMPASSSAAPGASSASSADHAHQRSAQSPSRPAAARAPDLPPSASGSPTAARSLSPARRRLARELEASTERGCAHAGVLASALERLSAEVQGLSQLPTATGAAAAASVPRGLRGSAMAKAEAPLTTRSPLPPLHAPSAVRSPAGGPHELPRGSTSRLDYAAVSISPPGALRLRERGQPPPDAQRSRFPRNVGRSFVGAPRSASDNGDYMAEPGARALPPARGQLRVATAATMTASEPDPSPHNTLDAGTHSSEGTPTAAPAFTDSAAPALADSVAPGGRGRPPLPSPQRGRAQVGGSVGAGVNGGLRIGDLSGPRLRRLAAGGDSLGSIHDTSSYSGSSGLGGHGAGASEPDAATSESVNGMHVLVVEDDAGLRATTVRHLRKLGVSCDTLEDGVDVIPWLLEGQPPHGGIGEGAASSLPFTSAATQTPLQRYDAILMDINLRTPSLLGCDVAAQLRARGVTVPIFAVTSNGGAEDAAHYARCGMHPRVLVKPFTRPQLAAMLALASTLAVADRCEG